MYNTFHTMQKFNFYQFLIGSNTNWCFIGTTLPRSKTTITAASAVGRKSVALGSTLGQSDSVTAELQCVSRSVTQ